MKVLCLYLSGLLFFLALCGNAHACSEHPIPMHFLGKNIYKEIDFRGFHSVNHIAPWADDDLYFSQGIDIGRWSILDNNRNYYRMTTEDGLVTKIFVRDECLTTVKGIKLGDPFSKVMSAYPDAWFIDGGDLPVVGASGSVGLSVLVDDEETRLSITSVGDFADIMGVNKGSVVDLEDPAVKSLAGKQVVYEIAVQHDIHRTPLHVAARHGRTETVNALVAAGADVNAKAGDNQTPLHRAVNGGRGRTATVKALIAAGADVNVKDDYGRTPLRVAAGEGFIEIVRALVAADVDLNARDVYSNIPLYVTMGYTPLHAAMVEGHMEIFQALVAAGADVNAKNNYGRTPLHDAVQAGHTKVVSALIAAGADVNAKDRYGETPLQMAMEKGEPETIEALKSAR